MSGYTISNYKDNQTFGRPRVYDYKKIAKELEEWSLKEDSIDIKRFLRDKEYDHSYLIQMTNRDSNLSKAYAKAKERIGSNRDVLLHNKALNEKCWNRYAAVYDKHLDDFETEQMYKKIKAEFAAKEVAALQNATPPNDEINSLKFKLALAEAKISELESKTKQVDGRGQ